MFCSPCWFFGTTSDNALTSVGFRDWKHAKGKNGTLTYHDSICSKHREGFLSWREYRSTTANNSSVAVHIERGQLKTIEDNRVYVRSIVGSILFCCQRGISLRGHRETINTEDTSVNIGNFRALTVLQSRCKEIIKQKLTSGPKNATWLGHDIQNSIISLLAYSAQMMIKNEV